MRPAALRLRAARAEQEAARTDLLASARREPLSFAELSVLVDDASNLVAEGRPGDWGDVDVGFAEAIDTDPSRLPKGWKNDRGDRMSVVRTVPALSSDDIPSTWIEFERFDECDGPVPAGGALVVGCCVGGDDVMWLDVGGLRWYRAMVERQDAAGLDIFSLFGAPSEPDE